MNAKSLEGFDVVVVMVGFFSFTEIGDPHRHLENTGDGVEFI